MPEIKDPCQAAFIEVHFNKRSLATVYFLFFAKATR